MKTKIYTLLLILFGIIPCFGQNNDLIETVRKGNKQIKSFTAKFTEMQYRHATKQSNELYGKMYYDAIGRIAMIYTEPEGDYVIIDGSTLVAKRKGKKNHFSGAKANAMTELSNSIMHSMTGEVSTVAEENDAEIRSKADNTYYNFVLTRRNIDPKQKHQIVKLTLRYDKRSCALVLLMVEEASGNTSTYALSAPQLNAEIPDNVFISKQ